ncbi:hypothetical protein XM52_13695 [Roseovarius indicus]|nr:hypothetical protein XM52_13695 [Roseovarius indicus]
MLAEEIGPVVRSLIDDATSPLKQEISHLKEILSQRSEGFSDVSKSVDRLEQQLNKAKEYVEAEKKAVSDRFDAIEAMEPPKPPELPDIASMVAEEVAKSIAKLPEPNPGMDGAPGKDGKTGEKGEPGKDGVGLAGAFIDRAGELTVTLTNGETRSLGVIVGKDGAPGKDGEDGIGFEDMDIVHDGERGFTFRFQRGAKIVERAFTLPVMLDRGVFSEGKGYAAGDVVSFGGSMWVAQKDTEERPGDGDGWRLSVKRGRDGKDGVMKPAPEPKTVKVK